MGEEGRGGAGLRGIAPARGGYSLVLATPPAFRPTTCCELADPFFASLKSTMRLLGEPGEGRGGSL